jgi:hypothetical protein
MSNIVEPQIVETKQSFIDLTKSGGWTGGINPNGMYTQKPINPIEGGQAFLDRQNQLAQQQAVMEQMTTYSGLTDKFFGKTEGYGIERTMKLGAYMILGAFVGRYVAKNMKKSTTLGMVVGGLAPLLVLKLTMEYDKKNMPKQEPRQKVAIEPTPSGMLQVKPYMPQVKPNAMPLDLSFQELSKTPNEFTIKSNGFNTRYYKDVSKTEGIFSFASPNLYKQPYSTTGMSGVQPTKISTREFLDAYNEFLKQPK